MLRQSRLLVRAIIFVLGAGLLIGCAPLAPRQTMTGTLPALVDPANADSGFDPTAIGTEASGDPAGEIAPPYRIGPIEARHDLGIYDLSILDVTLPIYQAPLDPAALRIPADGLQPSKGRFLDLRGTVGQLVHLGSDYKNPDNTSLVPPSDDSILAAAMYLERNTFEAIALDMSGNIQMYLVTLRMPDGVRQYLICYAHLERGSNEAALAQANAGGGHPQIIGRISPVSDNDPYLSDLHIGVIDVDKLYGRAGQSNLRQALLVLFSGQIARVDQQYADIFVRPEDVMTALEVLLAAPGP